MGQLRTDLTEEGYDSVQTYLQSGNVVLNSEIDDPERISRSVSDVITREYGVRTPVIVRSAEQMQAIAAWNPFPALAVTAPQLVHVLHLAHEPDSLASNTVLAADWDSDQLTINGLEVAIAYSESMHSSRLQHATLLRRLSVDGTARNWRTVLALAEMCE
jgi:uncharacterized protein (DUF1697 family)